MNSLCNPRNLAARQPSPANGARRKARRTRLAAAASAASLVLLSLPTGAASASAPVEPVPVMDLSGQRVAAGSAPIGSTNYAIPAGAIFIAPTGSDSATGTVQAPFKTMARAVGAAVSGATIVVRGGSYHEGVQIPANKRLTVQSYPRESVWFDGSRQISAWTATGNIWVSSGWTAQFDASPTYTRGAADGTSAGWSFVNAAHPMAAHPDQVWLDGRASDSSPIVSPGARGHLLR